MSAVNAHLRQVDSVQQHAIQKVYLMYRLWTDVPCPVCDVITHTGFEYRVLVAVRLQGREHCCEFLLIYSQKQNLCSVVSAIRLQETFVVRL